MWANLWRLESEGIEMPPYAWPPTFHSSCRFAHGGDSMQARPHRATYACLNERARKLRRRPGASGPGRASRHGHQQVVGEKEAGEDGGWFHLLAYAYRVFEHELRIALLQQRPQQPRSRANPAFARGRINVARGERD